MSSKVNKILIIGATSGLGREFARQFHSLGKKIIVTGRRKERLSELQQELSDIEIVEWDVSDLTAINKHAESILRSHPDLDTVFINAGISTMWSVLDPTSIANEKIEKEITTNVTAPIFMARAFLPHLAKLAESGKTSNLLVTSSGLGFTTVGFLPSYCPTKAAMHSFCLAVRQQINQASELVKKNLSICEIVPPAVQTEFGEEYRDKLPASVSNMKLDDYMKETMGNFEELQDGKLKKEVGAGSAIPRIAAWRDGVGALMAKWGLDC